MRHVEHGCNTTNEKEMVDVASKKREKARDSQLEKMTKGMNEILATLKHQNTAPIIVQALNFVTNAEKKKKLQEKLVAMVLDLN